MNTRHDDEPREPVTSYKPYMPPGKNRAQRRAAKSLRGRATRRSERRARRTVRETGLDKPWKRDQLADDEGDTVSLDLETGQVAASHADVAALEAHLD